MRLRPSTMAPIVVGQKVVTKQGLTLVLTMLKHPSGLRCGHQLSWIGNTPVFSCHVLIRDAGKNPVTF